MKRWIEVDCLFLFSLIPLIKGVVQKLSDSEKPMKRKRWNKPTPKRRPVHDRIGFKNKPEKSTTPVNT